MVKVQHITVTFGTSYTKVANQIMGVPLYEKNRNDQRRGIKPDKKLGNWIIVSGDLRAPLPVPRTPNTGVGVGILDVNNAAKPGHR